MCWGAAGTCDNFGCFYLAFFSGQAELELRQVTRQCCAWASAVPPSLSLPLPLLPPLPLLTMTRHRKLKMFSFECTKRRRVDCCCCCCLLCTLLLLYRLLLLFRLLLFSSSLLLLLLPVGATLAIFSCCYCSHTVFFSFCFTFGFFYVRYLRQCCCCPPLCPSLTVLPTPSVPLSLPLSFPRSLLAVPLPLPACAPVNSIWSHLASICSNLTYKLCQIAERSLSLSGFCEQFSRCSPSPPLLFPYSYLLLLLFSLTHLKQLVVAFAPFFFHQWLAQV